MGVVEGELDKGSYSKKAIAAIGGTVKNILVSSRE